MQRTPRMIKMKPLLNTTKFKTESDDTCVSHTNDRLGYGHNPDEVLGLQTEVCMSRKMTRLYDNPHDTLPRLNHNVLNVTDPGVVYVLPHQIP